MSTAQRVGEGIFGEVGLRGLFWISIGAHAVEGVYALYLARAEGMSWGEACRWGASTALYGYPSLKLLLRQVKKKERQR